jgi:hypothetical protein
VEVKKMVKLYSQEIENDEIEEVTLENLSNNKGVKTT